MINTQSEDEQKRRHWQYEKDVHVGCYVGVEIEKRIYCIVSTWEMVNTEDRLYSINIKNQIQYSITKLISFTYHWNCGLLCKLYHNKDGMLNWEVKLISRQVAVQNNSYQKHVM